MKPVTKPYTYDEAREIARNFPNRKLFMQIQDLSCKERGDKWINNKFVSGGDSYPYIQLYHETFIQNVIPYIPICGTFLDIGCGAGDKLALIRHLRPDVQIHGIEFDPELVKAAKELCPFARITKQDALEHPWLYNEYDVLYAYTIFKKKALWYGLIHEVMAHMKPGARFFAADCAGANAFNWDTPNFHTFSSIRVYTKKRKRRKRLD